MEFKFRAVDERPKPTPTPNPLSAITTYISERSLRGGFAGDVPATKIFRMPVAVSAGEAVRRELEREQIRREIEKEEIRRQILSGELARRRALEEEVTRELAMERALGIPMQRGLVTAGAEGFSFQEQVSVCMNQRRLNNSAIDNIFGVSQSQPQLPQLVGPPEMKHSPQNNKDKVIVLAKPDLNAFDAKRKAVMPPAGEPSLSGLQKKPKEDWSCALCQVSATSEKGLKDHLKGKKHKSKEAALRTPKIGLDAREDMQALQPCIAPAKSESQDTGCLESETEIATRKGGKVHGPMRKKLQFWCEFCQISTRSEIVMKSHKNGKKHLARMKKINQDNVIAPSSPSASQGADEQKIMQKTEESSSCSDKVQSMAESKGDTEGEEL